MSHTREELLLMKFTGMFCVTCIIYVCYVHYIAHGPVGLLRIKLSYLILSLTYNNKRTMMVLYRSPDQTDLYIYC